jgi:3-methylcrotonyl-CoA carboxylase alpha subunit
MFTKILIANRGEIACRVAATARKLGIKTVAVYSDADANAQHVKACDEAVWIGGAAPKDSYLKADVILAAAKATGAQAVHPGYGFLSENEAFAAACAAAGIAFIGPSPSAIEAMGLKAESKRLMAAAGVPLVPGYHGANQDAALLQREADAMGYPVLIKASAGGGGKGMRIVEKTDDFAAALASCQREAASSFGDTAVLIEKYLQRPRHIEIQVFADAHGNCVYLFERDCSVQRRHQKVLEEAPAPHMNPAMRAAMGEAAVAAAKAVNYVGAGTVEFIVETDGRAVAEPPQDGEASPTGGGADAQASSWGANFYFMEMNTRLQVEHPVTEMITGFDLVEWQLRVAAGLPLPVSQTDLHIEGHAFEARIYAEHPEKGFLPSIGTLQHLHLPAHCSFVVNRGQTRVDSGVIQGDAITPNYDPMIAKLIVWGADREQALARMAAALAQTRIVGLRSNVVFLSRLCANPAFAAGEVHTGLIEQEAAQLLPTGGFLPYRALLLAMSQTPTWVNHDPFAATDGWRMGGISNTRSRRFEYEGTSFTAQLSHTPAGLHAAWAAGITGEAAMAINFTAYTANGNATTTTITTPCEQFTGSVVKSQAQSKPAHWVFVDGQVIELIKMDLYAGDAVASAAGGSLAAPMPGKIVAHLAAIGSTVEAGAPLLVMEAMKMEHTIAAPSKGVVKGYPFPAGAQVTDGAVLVDFEVVV